MPNRNVIFRFGDVEVREREFSLTKAGEALPVEPKAFRVLLILLRNPGKLIPKEELMNAVWGDAAVTENSLTRSIALLRRLLGDDARTPRFIETVTTVGYRWVGRVVAMEDLAGAPPVSDPPPAGEVSAAANGGGAVLAERSAPARNPIRSGRHWIILAGTAVVVLAAGGFWYVSRPLPLPRITPYIQITHDGRDKRLGGTDGSRIYFTQFSPNAILQVGVNGGEAAPIPISLPGFMSRLADISPDGSNALIVTNEAGTNPMWVVPIPGGAATRLGDGIGESFSPDGASVIYSTRKGDIFMVRTDGTENHQLASVGSVAAWFSWLPNGRTIRFTNDDMLWEMSADGSGLHRLLADWHEQGIQCCGRWTPDGQLYLFQLSNYSRPGGEIWALEEGRRPFRGGTADPIRLTTGPMLWGQPIPSRDGKKIFATGITPRGELSRIDAKTGGIQPILGGISAEFVSFSVNGKSVAYVSFPEGILWKANRDRSNRVRLSGPPYYPVNPRWSPDSKQILFISVTPDNHGATYLVSTEGGTPRKLLPDDDVLTGDANWSPDGKRILLDWGSMYSPPEKRDLRILDLDSRQLTTIPGSTGLWSSRWSPDGRYIAAFAYPQTPVLRIFDFKTQRWAALPTSGDAEFPSFSRDSRFIYFVRYGRDQSVFRFPVTGGKEERVVDGTQWHTTGYFGYSMTLDPTDAPLVLRDVGSDDIYALTLEVK